MSKPEWIHEPNDGRGARLVFCAGILQLRAVYADVRRGFVKVARKDNPLQHDIVRGYVSVRPHP